MEEKEKLINQIIDKIKQDIKNNSNLDYLSYFLSCVDQDELKYFLNNLKLP